MECGEAREVDRGGKDSEIGVHLCAAADTGASAAVLASHQVSDLPFDLRAGGCVVGFPRRICLPFAAACKLLLVRAKTDDPSIW